jgi:poly(A) polymerase
VKIVRRLVEAGHTALLAGGCVRDLLRGVEPHDYDVATDAPPDRVQALFRATRHVGVQFGVVLVRQKREWVEVATFRTEGRYADGRRPEEVHFTDAAHDAFRRDFTINGMFLDPLGAAVIDYVGGAADLESRQIRAIGVPAERFAEDHLRLLRAVRFAARLDFALEAETRQAITVHAARLSGVARERVHDELERMLVHPRRARAVALLAETGLLEHLWGEVDWSEEDVAAARALLEQLPEEADFALCLAALLGRRTPETVDALARDLACSNEERATAAWLVEHQADLDVPAEATLAALKRLMQHPAFGDLRKLVGARLAGQSKGQARLRELDRRVAGIPADAVDPPPLVTGADLIAREVTPGPIFKRVLDQLYTEQLDETLTSREAGLARAEELLGESPRTPADD